jgi:hypothetical protein
MMEFDTNFSMRIGNLEAKACNIHLIGKMPFNYVEISKWSKTQINGVEQEYRYVIAVIEPSKDEDADIRSIGMRMWDEKDIETIEHLHRVSSKFLIDEYTRQHE